LKHDGLNVQRMPRKEGHNETTFWSKVIALTKKDLNTRLRDIKENLCSFFCPILFCLVLALVVTQNSKTLKNLQVKTKSSPTYSDWNITSDNPYDYQFAVDFDKDMKSNDTQDILKCLEEKFNAKTDVHQEFTMVPKSSASQDALPTLAEITFYVEDLYDIHSSYIEAEETSPYRESFQWNEDDVGNAFDGVSWPDETDTELLQTIFTSVLKEFTVEDHGFEIEKEQLNCVAYGAWADP